MSDDKVIQKKLPGKRKPPVRNIEGGLAVPDAAAGEKSDAKKVPVTKLPGKNKSPEVTLTRGIAPMKIKTEEKPASLPIKSKNKMPLNKVAAVTSATPAAENNPDQDTTSKKLTGLRKFPNLTMKRGVAGKPTGGSMTPAKLPGKKKPPVPAIKKAANKKVAAKKAGPKK